MDTPKWTPGPWLKVTTGNIGNLIETADHKIVGTFQSTHWRADRDDEAAANGSLIAAAPDLYGALESTLSLLKVFTSRDDSIAKAVWDQAEAALAKAEGREP